MKKTLEFAELEQVYDLVALAIEAHRAGKQSAFLQQTRDDPGAPRG